MRTMQKKLTIANGQTVSDACDVQGWILAAIGIPAAFTGASLTFQGDIDGSGTYQSIVDSAGTAYTVTLGGANRIVLPRSSDPVLTGVISLKIVSASAEAAERVVTLHFVATQADQ